MLFQKLISFCEKNIIEDRTCYFLSVFHFECLFR